MKKKNTLLVIAPVLPQSSDIGSIASTLSFLDNYHIDFIDPLSISDDLPNESYYQLWKKKLGEWLPNYNAFLGFSFGGVILQQCFSLFEKVKKPIILFSTPTFADNPLTKKLGEVIHLCKENRLDEALAFLYRDVFYPNEPPRESFKISDNSLAAKRLIFGLKRVLDTDSTQILQQTSVDHLHLIGEYSNLVNKENVIAPHTGSLLIVPKASMRVLQDNPAYCKKVILERLNSEI